MGLLSSIFSGIAGGARPRNGLSEAEIAEIIESHAQSRGIAFSAEQADAEADPLDAYLQRLGGCPADEFEVRLLVWLGRSFGVRPVFNLGTKAGYWTFSWHGEEVALNVVGPGKSTCESEMRAEIPWRLRMEQMPPARFIERMKEEFAPENPVVGKRHGKVRVQFNAAGLRPGGGLARALEG